MFNISVNKVSRTTPIVSTKDSQNVAKEVKFTFINSAKGCPNFIVICADQIGVSIHRFERYIRGYVSPSLIETIVLEKKLAVPASIFFSPKTQEEYFGRDYISPRKKEDREVFKLLVESGKEDKALLMKSKEIIVTRNLSK